VPGFIVQPWFTDVHGGILERLRRLGERVPPGVELGYHLCYGDYEHAGALVLGIGGRPRSRLARRAAGRLLREVNVRLMGPPNDMRAVVELAAALLRSTSRRIDYLHLPVPRSAGEAHLAPLASLQPPSQVQIYLGLIHHHDGLAGARRRIAIASRALARFGVATECGWGRRDPETIPGLVELHRQLAAVEAP
jgi:hypothetical protein